MHHVAQFDGLVGLHRPQDVLVVKDAQDLIHVVLVHRQPGKAALDEIPQDIGRLRTDVHGVNLGSGDHHGSHGRVCEIEDAVDQLFLGFVEDPLGRALPDQRLDLFLGDEAGGSGVLAPEDPQDPVAGAGQQLYQERRTSGDGVDGKRHEERDPLGKAQRQGLGHQFAEDQAQIGDGQDHDEDGGVVAPGLGIGDRQRLDLRLQELDGPGASDGGGQGAHESDTDLDRGQKPVGLLLEPVQGRRRARALAFDAVGTRPARGDYGDLRGREETVGQDQQEDDRCTQPYAVKHENNLPSGMPGRKRALKNHATGRAGRGDSPRTFSLA